MNRIRKGVSSEAKIVARVLPALLLDFFPAQEIMNKVIGEFLSSQQPHPELIAQVLFKVRMSLNSWLVVSVRLSSHGSTREVAKHEGRVRVTRGNSRERLWLPPPVLTNFSVSRK